MIGILFLNKVNNKIGLNIQLVSFKIQLRVGRAYSCSNYHTIVHDM